MNLSEFLSLEIPGQEGDATLTNYHLHLDCTLKSPLMVEIISAIRGSELSHNEAGERIASILNASFGVGERFVRYLEQLGILSESDLEPASLKEMRQSWCDYGWEAAFYFHLFTKDYPFLDYSEDGMAIDRELMEAYGAASQRPPNTKSYEAPVVPLSLPSKLGSSCYSQEDWNAIFLLQSRASAIPLTLETLSEILYYMAGKFGTKHWHGQGHFLFKHVPSGGARHPTEVYLISLGLENLSPGVYHYNVEQHGLDTIELCQDTASLLDHTYKAIPDLRRRVEFPPSIILLFSSIVERSMWRYRDSRSFRVILIDLGHIMSAFRMLATTVGVRFWVGQGVVEQHAADLIKVDPLHEPILFAGALA